MCMTHQVTQMIFLQIDRAKQKLVLYIISPIETLVTEMSKNYH